MFRLGLIIIFSLWVPVALPAQGKGQGIDPEARVTELLNHNKSLGEAWNPKSAFDTLRKAVALEKELDPNGTVRQDLHFEIGQNFMRINAGFLAARQFEICLAIESNRGKPDLHTIGAVGSAYMRAADWEKSEYYFRMAIAAADQMEPFRLSPTLNNLGIMFLEKGEADSAAHYFHEAMEAYIRAPMQDTLYPGSIRDNQAQTALLQGDLNTALQAYLRNTLNYANGRRPFRRVQATLGVADVFLRQGRYSAALPYLRQSAEWLPRVQQRHHVRLEKQYQLLHLNYLRGIGDREGLIRAQEAQLRFLDSLNQVQEENLLAVYSLQASLQQREMEREDQLHRLHIRESEARIEEQNRLTLLRIAVIAVALLLTALLFFRWLHFRSVTLRKQVELNEARNKLLAAELEKEKLEKENLHLQVHLKEQDLTNFALDNRRKHELLRHVEHRLRQLGPGEHNPAALRGIMNELRIQLQDEATLKFYQENIEEVNEEFRKALLARFPKLSRMEIELCGMVRLGMQSKEIANMRSVTENAVTMARKRLRKKLKLEPGVDLGQFLKSI